MTIGAAAEASTRDLVAALTPIAGAAITSLERRPSPYRSSHPLEMLTVATADGRRTQLVFKDLSPAALGDVARAAKAEVEGPGWRELDVYRDVLATVPTFVPERRWEHRDERTGQYWLFLEPIEGAELPAVGEFEVWGAALGGLARLHDALKRSPRPASLGRYDKRFFGRWPARAVELSAAGDRALLGRVAERYDGVIERLGAMPTGIVHGDLYPSNVMIRTGDDAGRERMVVLDWESAGVGPQLLDVATLTAGSWSGEQRDRLALAYRASLPTADRTDRERFLVDLDCCRLHLALQWLGWSRAWSPPPQHRHDWTAEARAAAERLELL